MAFLCGMSSLFVIVTPFIRIIFSLCFLFHIFDMGLFDCRFGFSFFSSPELSYPLTLKDQSWLFLGPCPLDWSPLFSYVLSLDFDIDACFSASAFLFFSFPCILMLGGERLPGYHDYIATPCESRTNAIGHFIALIFLRCYLRWCLRVRYWTGRWRYIVTLVPSEIWSTCQCLKLITLWT